MDYQQFYNEVVNWILSANQMAIQHGLESEAFWNWVMASSAEMCRRYENNPLVLKQMVMLFEWLDDVYAKGKK